MGSIRPRILKVVDASMVDASIVDVAVGSIRPRILKATGSRIHRRRGRPVAVGSIRPRILKEKEQPPVAQGEGVAVGSIRPRILKVSLLSYSILQPVGCSGLDPTEDTESSPARLVWRVVRRLQWARSDRGY